MSIAGGVLKNSIVRHGNRSEETQLLNRCQNVPVKREGGSDRANQTFFRQAQAHICAYYMIWSERQGRGSTKTNKSALMTDLTKIEKLVKRFKTHCCALGG